MSANLFAIVTGASTGIGFELAKCCAKAGFDLLVVADEPQIEESVEQLLTFGHGVQSLQEDLSTMDGVEGLCAAAKGRNVDFLFANALTERKDGVIPGLSNKIQVAAAKLMSSSTLAEKHRDQTAPGSARGE